MITGNESNTAAIIRVEPRKVDTANARPKQPPMWNVILHNDDVNTMDFVIRTLQKVFHYPYPKATILTLRAHLTGKSCIWTGMKEHAELRAEQIHSCGPDPIMRDRGAMSLGVTLEPESEH